MPAAALRRRWWVFALKAAVSLGLLAWVVHAALARAGMDALLSRLSDLAPSWLCAAVALQLAAVGAGLLRWRLLLRAQGLALPLGWLARCYLVGRFVGAFTPSTAGLDVYRGYAVARRTGEAARSASAIISEKFVGLLGLALLCLALMATVGHDALGPHAAWSAALVAAGAGTGLWLMLRPERAERLAHLAPRAARTKLSKLLSALAAPGLGPAVLAKAVALGFVGHLSVSSVFVATALALGLDASPAALLMTGNLIVLATLLPISIGGVGVREGVAVLLLARAGVSAGDAILVALLGYVTGQVPALAGGVLSLLPSSARGGERPTPTRAR